MDTELFALRQQVYATAAAYHGAGASWMTTRRAGAPAEFAARDVFLTAGVEYDAALVRLLDHLSTTAAGARNGELERTQHTRELLGEELALLRAHQT